VRRHLINTFEAMGSSLDQVVKAQVSLTDLNDFYGFDTVWRCYFKVPPRNTTIGCRTKVESDLIGTIG